MKTNLYRISNGFAANSGLPVAFTAATLIETQKALYVYGHGESDPQGSCARCGRALTHPGSILIGIGPECLKDWGARDSRLTNLSESDIAYLKSLVTDRKVDLWIPKSCIQLIQPANEEITPPKEHKMLQPKTKQTKAEKNTQWAGGAFVDFNDCTKLNNKPAGAGCSQGAVDNVVKLKKTSGNINAPSLSKGKQ
jgi:hypothetical protein